MRKVENYTIVHKSSGNHYDTNDQRFYSDSWERSQDTKKYLQQIMENDPDKFEGCEIQ